MSCTCKLMCVDLARCISIQIHPDMLMIITFASYQGGTSCMPLAETPQVFALH